MKKHPLAADRKILNDDYPNAVDPSLMHAATAGADGWQWLDLSNHEMKTTSIILNHMGHFVVWYV